MGMQSRRRNRPEVEDSAATDPVVPPTEWSRRDPEDCMTERLAAISVACDLHTMRPKDVVAAVRAGDAATCRALTSIQLAHARLFPPLFRAGLLEACAAHFRFPDTLAAKTEPSGSSLSDLHLLLNLSANPLVRRAMAQDDLTRWRVAAATVLAPVAVRLVSSPEEALWGAREQWLACLPLLAGLLYNIVLSLEAKRALQQHVGTDALNTFVVRLLFLEGVPTDLLAQSMATCRRCAIGALQELLTLTLTLTLSLSLTLTLTPTLTLSLTLTLTLTLTLPPTLTLTLTPAPTLNKALTLTRS